MTVINGAVKDVFNDKNVRLKQFKILTISKRKKNSKKNFQNR